MRRARLGRGGCAMSSGGLGKRIEDRALVRARAGHEDHARPGRPDEDVARAGRTVDEVPGAKVPFLLLDDEEALAGENEEILLLGLGVIQAARLPRLEDVEAEAELREEDLLQLRALAQRWTVCLERSSASRSRDSPPRPRRRRSGRTSRHRRERGRTRLQRGALRARRY